MEKKKLLLVAVSVGVVMLIIIGIPLFVFSPKQNQKSRNLTPVESIQQQIIIPETQDLVQNREIQTIPEAITPVQEETPTVTTFNIPVPHTAAVPSVPVTTASRPAASAKPAQPKPQPAAVKPAPEKPVETPKVTAVKPPAAKPAAETIKTSNNYWVQTGAFSTKVRAEGAKESLEAKGIASIIDNSDVNGKTWYRVRVGPYISENEANYWLALVKSIDGFNDSQIRMTQVR